MVAIPVSLLTDGCIVELGGVLSTDPLFLHFINRELMFIRRENLREEDHIALIKRAGLMTSGYLLAPFAQVHEIYWKKRNANALIATLCGVGKLCITNAATDFYTFMESRRELYGPRQEKYPMYFGRKTAEANNYLRPPSLDTTNYIKRALLTAVNQPGAVSNLIGYDDVMRIQENALYVRDELQQSKSAATFSLFETGQILPKPQEIQFFGRLSSRLFVNHYSSSLALHVPTGILNDPLVETFDKFPIYDLELQRILLNKIGIDHIACDIEFHNPYLNLLNDPDFPSFSHQREILIRVLTSAVGSEVGLLSNIFKVAPLLCSMDFGVQGSAQYPSAAVLTMRMARALERTAASNRQVAEAMTRLNMIGQQEASIIVFTATDVEDVAFKAVCAIAGYVLQEVSTRRGFTGTLYTKPTSIKIWHVRTSAGSSGASGSARLSELALREFRPSFAFAVGIGFAIEEDRDFGSVMISEYVFGYEKVKIKARGVQWRGDKIPTSSDVVSLARAYGEINSAFKVITGGIFSGEKLIDRRNFRDDIARLDPKAIGGEMEAAGLTQSCQICNVSFSMIKGISDFATGKNDGKQTVAAQNACVFLFEAIRRLDGVGMFASARGNEQH